MKISKPPKQLLLPTLCLLLSGAAASASPSAPQAPDHARNTPHTASTKNAATRKSNTHANSHPTHQQYVELLKPGDKLTLNGVHGLRRIEIVRRKHPTVSHTKSTARAPFRLHQSHSVKHREILLDEDTQTYADAKAWRERRGNGKFPKQQILAEPR